MSNSTKFLELYNHLDDLLRDYYHDFNNSHSLIARFCNYLETSNYQNLQIRGKKLNEIRIIRNNLIHELDMNHDELIEITDNAIAFLEKEIELLEKPLRAIDIATSFTKIEKVTLSSDVKSLLKIMVEKGFMNIPVVDDNEQLIGVFSPNVLFVYLASNFHMLAPKGILKMSDFINLIPVDKHVSEYYEFVAKNTLAEDITDLFSKYLKKGKKLAVCFVTENGKQDEKILGLITSHDVVNIDNF